MLSLVGFYLLKNGISLANLPYFKNFTQITWHYPVTGGIAGLGIPNGSTLLSGTWTSAEVTNFTGTTWAIVLGSFVDTKNDTLVTYYGLPTGTNNYTWIINLTFTTSAVVVPPAAFSTGSVLSGDVTNQPVPEPSIILLMGAGLIGIWGFSKRIIKR